MKSAITILCLLSLLAISSTYSNTGNKDRAEIEKLQMELESLKETIIKNEPKMKKEIATFLTFQDNNAENAMNFYVELFDNSKIVSLQRWGEGAPGEEGRIMHAVFDLSGNLFMCSDSPPVHDWDFTPAVSNFIDCDSEAELERLFSKLSENGTVTMPLNNYGFSQKFGWVIDQFGISWQLNLP